MSYPLVVGKYQLLRQLGEGSFGRVCLGVHRDSGERVAIKMCRRAQMKTGDAQRIVKEVSILKRLDHPNIVKVLEVQEDDQFLYVIMEYVAGGELFDYITAHQKIPEDEARNFLAQIVQAIQYIHSMGVIHRDLKPENVLLDVRNRVKIIDFGLAAVLEGSDLRTAACGSPHYTSPEMIEGRGYSYPVDIWAMGVIVFAMVCGYLPFDNRNPQVMIKNITSGKYYFPSGLSLEVRHLISSMLCIDPVNRISCVGILKHPWLHGETSSGLNFYTPLAIVGPSSSVSSLDSSSTNTMPDWQAEREEQIAFIQQNRVSVIESDLKSRRKRAYGRRHSSVGVSSLQLIAHQHSAIQSPAAWSPNTFSGSFSGYPLKQVNPFPYPSVLEPVVEAEEEEEDESEKEEREAKRFSRDFPEISKLTLGPLEQSVIPHDIDAVMLYMNPMTSSVPLAPISEERKRKPSMGSMSDGLPAIEPEVMEVSQSLPGSANHSAAVSPIPFQRRISGPSFNVGVPPLDLHEGRRKALEKRRHQRKWIQAASPSSNIQAPAYFTGKFTESSVSSLPSSTILTSLESVLEFLNFSHVRSSKFVLTARSPPDPETGQYIELDLSIYRLSNLDQLHVVVARRRAGDIWAYMDLYRRIMAMFHSISETHR